MKKNTTTTRKSRSTAAVNPVHGAEMRIAYQVAGLRGKKLLERFPQYSKAAVYKHANKPLCGEMTVDKRKLNKGRPAKISERDQRMLKRKLNDLRQTEGSFTSKRLQLVSGLTAVSNRTVRRALNKCGYHYLRSRKKGLLRAADLKKRLKYCREVREQKKTQDWWNYGISFYLDGTGFVYKSNPMDQATAPRAREWRLLSEGLMLGCTAKGAKEGTTKANFMVAISYDRGVVLCEQYIGRISGAKFAKLADQTFEQSFNLSINPYDRFFLQDGDPSQNSKKANMVFEKFGATVVGIPPRSPDLNPIENYFNLVQMRLNQDTIQKNITKETFVEFSARVHDIMVNFSCKEINSIIETMDKRVTMIINSKGNRIKY